MPPYVVHCACATVEDSLTSLYDFIFIVRQSTRTHCLTLSFSLSGNFLQIWLVRAALVTYSSMSLALQQSSASPRTMLRFFVSYPNVSNCWHSSIRPLRCLWRNVSCHHHQHPQLHTISSGFQLAFLWSVPHISLFLFSIVLVLFSISLALRLSSHTWVFSLCIISIIFECVLCSNDAKIFCRNKNYSVANFTDRRWKVVTKKRNKKRKMVRRHKLSAVSNVIDPCVVWKTFLIWMKIASTSRMPGNCRPKKQSKQCYREANSTTTDP